MKDQTANILQGDNEENKKVYYDILTDYHKHVRFYLAKL